MGTTTQVVNVKKTVAPAKSSPPKKGEKTNKPSSPKQQVEPVHESDAYFTVQTHKGKSKESSPVTSVHISPIKFKERLKISYQASDCITDIEIKPSRSELKKNTFEKVEKSILYSDVHKQRPIADDFFDGVPQQANQTDILLTSASDLETNVMNKRRLKKNIIRLPVD